MLLLPWQIQPEMIYPDLEHSLAPSERFKSLQSAASSLEPSSSQRSDLFSLFGPQHVADPSSFLVHTASSSLEETEGTGVRPPAGLKVCHICGKGFSGKRDLIRHVRSHTGERPFQCPACHYRASIKSHMKRHMFLKHQLNISDFPVDKVPG